ncbi:MAG: AbrB/MazE/SpoVT family DNA-binding domain-containing protein [Nanoarchaeota archaeon]
MKKFMETCYKCKGKVNIATSIKKGVGLNCLKCQNCGEEYFTSSELLRFDILTGRKELVRKFGSLGDSTIIRIPNKVLKDFKIKPKDYGVFEARPDGILIKPVSAKEVHA